jgi:hypothetical protein
VVEVGLLKPRVVSILRVLDSDILEPTKATNPDKLFVSAALEDCGKPGQWYNGIIAVDMGIWMVDETKAYN